jgi:hypothetical protein
VVCSMVVRLTRALESIEIILSGFECVSGGATVRPRDSACSRIRYTCRHQPIIYDLYSLGYGPIFGCKVVIVAVS